MLRLAQSTDWMVEHLMHVEEVPGLAFLGISKHVIGIFVVGLLLTLTFVPFGRALSRDYVPRGRFVNFLEVILLFIRDEVTRPFLGKEGDRFLPVLWTFFFFILYSNLLGLFPILPAPVLHDGHVTLSWSTVTPTGQVWVTGALAITAAIWWHGHGIREQGLITYLKNIVPGGLPLALLPLMIVVEIFSHLIKPMALMLRLWANMMGGHAVLYAMLGLIFLFGSGVAGIFVIPLSVAMAAAVYVLELFVAFLQAYVFTFLVTVFLGAAVHPDH
ncbi:MAG: F0F1 ATP synthase subunit A [Planctomycetes bacterium]|nr:F0F1 ATP synthase subunit A [Planctomycetota bacterium]